MAITIDGVKYKVIEDLGYQHSAGCYAKVVETKDGEKVAVKIGSSWQFNKPKVYFSSGDRACGQ